MVETQWTKVIAMGFFPCFLGWSSLMETSLTVVFSSFFLWFLTERPPNGDGGIPSSHRVAKVTVLFSFLHDSYPPWPWVAVMKPGGVLSTQVAMVVV